MNLTRLLAGSLGLILVLALLSTGVTAGAGVGGEEPKDDRTQVGPIDITLEDRHITISDVEASGDGLPAVEIDERTIAIHSATASIDGMTVNVRGTTYEVGPLQIGLENVGIQLEEISIGSAPPADE